jgi:hypothetical protein
MIDTQTLILIIKTSFGLGAIGGIMIYGLLLVFAMIIYERFQLIRTLKLFKSEYDKKLIRALFLIREPTKKRIDIKKLFGR